MGGKDIYFKHLSTLDGLSQPSAISIWQDRLGNMWFGNNLLNRYDGNHIKTFRISDFINDIQDTNIKQICGDSKTTMYALVNTELISYDYFTGRFSKMNIEANCVCVLNDALYYAWENVIFKYDVIQGKSVKVIELPSTVKCMLFLDEKNYWVGASDGVYKVDEGKKLKIFSEESISCLFRDSHSNIWVGTRDSGAWIIKPNGEIFDLKTEISIYRNSNFLLNRIRDIKEDNQQNIWIGTYNGIIVFSPFSQSAYLLAHDEVKPYSLKNNSVYSLYKDEQGTMWVGTYYGGASYFNPDIELYTYYGTSKTNKDMLNGLIIGEMAEDDDENLFIATEDGGLNILDRKKNTVTRYDNENSLMPHNTIKSLWYDSEKSKLYIGTFTEGLVVYNKKTNFFKRVGQDFLKTFGQKIINQIIPYNESLLISTQEGIYKLDRETEELSIPNNDNIFSTDDLGLIQTMSIDEDNILWLFSSLKGLSNIDLNRNKSNYFNEIDTIIKKNSIIRIKSDGKGKIYFLTDGSGILVYNKSTKIFSSYLFVILIACYLISIKL